MLWNPLRKYIISTFPLKTLSIYYVAIYSVFPLLLVYEYSNDRWVFFQDRRNSKWVTHELLTKVAFNLYCKSKDGDEQVCFLRAVASYILILG